MSRGSGSATTTGATAITTAEWCGGAITTTIITTTITVTDTTIIITGTTTGTVTDRAGAPLCNAYGANGRSCGGSSRWEGPPTYARTLLRPDDATGGDRMNAR
jgi:hypothetical protein